MSIEIRQLRYFITVAEELNFARAAKRLAMAQPPLSQAIRNLETELGVELFDRTRRPIALTRAGRALFAEALPIIDQIAYVIEATRRAGTNKGGHLEIGAVSAAQLGVLPRLLSVFHAAYPDVQIGINEITSSRQLAALREGRIDIGFFHSPVYDPMLETRAVHSESLSLVLPAAYDLSSRRPVGLSELRSETFVMFDRAESPALYDQIISLCRAAGFRPRIRQHVNRFTTIISLVAVGIGVAIVPSSIERMATSGVVFQSICDPMATCEIHACWRASETAQEVRNLISLIEPA
ncbi:LysR family transcriptional regulator [bacterium]|nr:MAG: LysR family transcriptional regulator [bacterium]